MKPLTLDVCYGSFEKSPDENISLLAGKTYFDYRTVEEGHA